MKKKHLFQSLALTAVLAGGWALWDMESASNVPVLGHGEIQALKSTYQKWVAGYEGHGGKPEVLRLALSYSKALSSTTTGASGLAEVDLVEGDVTIRLQNLENGKVDAWLVDNRGPEGLKPDNDDGLVKLGTIEAVDGKGELHARLDRAQLQGFTLDMVAITPADTSPVANVLLAGSPGLLQQVYYSDKLWTMTAVGGLEGNGHRNGAPFDFLLPKLARADGGKGASRGVALEDVLGEQIAKGREIFANETFDGNGRTCATCHRLDNNHTIDPQYISKLPPDDPLFVAEYNTELSALEKPALMRQFGLILANADGFDKPGVMRSVPHTLALATSIDIETDCNQGEFPDDQLYTNALGWAGDGSPNQGVRVNCHDTTQVIPHPNGSLRDFAIGAIKQHMPKTLNRVEGKDFRMPTDEELVAMEAYMLSLGRSKDYDLAKLTFSSPVVEKGRALFDTKENACRPANGGDPVKQDHGACPAGSTLIVGESANCNGCHSNAGARSSTTYANPTRNTGVENMRDQPATLTDTSIPIDGGFGATTQDICSHFEQTDPFSDEHPCFGDKRFNTPPLVEAADTAPFFHNHSVNSIEEAVAFYNTDAFNNSPGALTSKRNDRKVKLDSSQVVAVALFLRSLNALENIRQANVLDAQAMQLRGQDAREIASLAMRETLDALNVLKGGSVYPNPEVIAKLEEAYKLEKMAGRAPSMLRSMMLEKSVKLKKEAKDLMVTCDDSKPSQPTTRPQDVYTCADLS